jgi:hypothetical protein
MVVRLRGLGFGAADDVGRGFVAVTGGVGVCGGGSSLSGALLSSGVLGSGVLGSGVLV